MRITKMFRKLPFENVVNNLRNGKYSGKICQADYSNCGVRLFQEKKFAGNLGVSYLVLREIGLIKITEQVGWNLPREPTVEELINLKDKIMEVQNATV